MAHLGSIEPALGGPGKVDLRNDNSWHASANGHGMEFNDSFTGKAIGMGDREVLRYMRSRQSAIADRLGEFGSKLWGTSGSATIFPNFAFLRSVKRAAAASASDSPKLLPTNDARAMPSTSIRPISWRTQCFMSQTWSSLRSVWPKPAMSGAITRKRSENAGITRFQFVQAEAPGPIREAG